MYSMRSCLASRRSVSGWGLVTHGAMALQPKWISLPFDTPEGKGAPWTGARHLSRKARQVNTSRPGLVHFVPGAYADSAVARLSSGPSSRGILPRRASLPLLQIR